MNSAPVTGALDAQTFRNIAKAQSPMVVNIRTEMTASGAGAVGLLRRRRRRCAGRFPPPLLRQPGGGQDEQAAEDKASGAPPPAPREQTTVAAGTGFIISKDGLILTNNHVVEDATKIEVSLFGERRRSAYQAKLIGRDALTDSALIQLTEKPNHPLPEAKFGDSSQMAAGDWVMAIGNPFGYAHTVTVGVISATERAVPATDGRIERDDPDRRRDQPGQLRRAAAQHPRRGDRHEHRDHQQRAGREGNIGIGFAVPINTVRDLLPQLRIGQGRPRPHRRADAGGAARRLRGLRPEDAQPARSSSQRRARRRRRRRPASSRATSSSSSTAAP